MQRPSQADAGSYALLPTDELGTESKEAVGEESVDDGLFGIHWMRLCAVASVILAMLSFFVPSPTSLTTLPIFTSRAARLAYAATLPRPSMYIGLSRLNRTTALAALPDELTYFPHVFAPVSRSEPDKVWPTDGHERRTFNGVVSPGEPLVLIDSSSGTSMIMQFRVQDYGMERCSIAVILPSLSDARLKEQNRTLLLSSTRIQLDIWQLETHGNKELDLTSLNWNTRPARSALIATVDAEEGGEIHTPDFNCGTSGSLRTFEVACSESVKDEECKIGLRQGQPEMVPRMAFVVVQKPSL